MAILPQSAPFIRSTVPSLKMSVAFIVTAAGLTFAPSPALRPRFDATARTVAPTMGVTDMVNSVKDSIIPNNGEETLRNVFGYQALAWGVGGLFAPAFMTTEILGQTVCATSTLCMRGIALGNLALAGRFTRGTDSDAATSGLIWFALWYNTLKNVGFGTSGYVPVLATGNAIMALVAARRRGGLWKSITTADTELLDTLLPRDYKTSVRNVIGMQMSLWGLAGLFFPTALAATLGLAMSPFVSALTAGNAVTNLVLGGRVMGGSDEDAAANGVVFFGGWATLVYLAKAAGTLTGANLNLLIVWNGACAAYCAWKLAQ